MDIVEKALEELKQAEGVLKLLGQLGWKLRPLKIEEEYNCEERKGEPFIWLGLTIYKRIKGDEAKQMERDAGPVNMWIHRTTQAELKKE